MGMGENFETIQEIILPSNTHPPPAAARRLYFLIFAAEYSILFEATKETDCSQQAWKGRGDSASQNASGFLGCKFCHIFPEKEAP